VNGVRCRERVIAEGGDGFAEHIKNIPIIVNDHDTNLVSNHRG